MSSTVDDLLLTMNDADVEKFLALLIKEKKGKPKAKKKKEKYIQIEYQGKVTFTCTTCSKIFNRTFTTNIKDRHIHKSAPTCIYCKDMLLYKTKEDLILMIMSDRKDIKRIG